VTKLAVTTSLVLKLMLAASGLFKTSVSAPTPVVTEPMLLSVASVLPV
jgi:hypothetical protein